MAIPLDSRQPIFHKPLAGRRQRLIPCTCAGKNQAQAAFLAFIHPPLRYFQRGVLTGVVREEFSYHERITTSLAVTGSRGGHTATRECPRGSGSVDVTDRPRRGASPRVPAIW